MALATDASDRVVTSAAGRACRCEDSAVPTLAVVVVTYNSASALERSLPALTAQLRDGDELIVVDNASRDETVARVGELAPEATLVESRSNLGFPAACNLGAQAASSELLCFLNPDAVPQPGLRDAIERPALDGSGWTAWQGLVASDSGALVSSAGGVLHFTGIAWAGAAGHPRGTPVERLGFLSGACLVIGRERFHELGGFADDYFLYHEDVDLSLRVLLAGGAIGVCTDAIVHHDYDFDKGPAKWRHLERNRWATIVRTYPAPLLVLLAPALLVVELAIVVASLRGGWWRQKLLAAADSVESLPRWFRERRRVQRGRKLSASRFADTMVATLDSEYIGPAARSPLVAASLRTYWRAVRALLGVRL
jgi:N-acetylglucosaminyl-diphospho-decaprenol L-rhamnosyltransferase